MGQFKRENKKAGASSLCEVKRRECSNTAHRHHSVEVIKQLCKLSQGLPLNEDNGVWC